MPEFKNITKKYGSDTVLENFSLKLEKDSPVVIMGESGKGKTTLLRIMSGLEMPDSGNLITDGEKTAFMFQEPRLLPWRNAIDNVRAVLRKTDTDLAENYFSKVGLDIGSDGKKYPSELSGGMRQRVAFARFLAYAETNKATLLLLDEPFSALDTETAERMAELLKRAAQGKYLAVVSHDESDAQMLGADIIKI